MQKYIKYSSLIFVGILAFASLAYAEETTTAVPPQNPSVTSPQPFGAIRKELKDKKMEIKDQKAELKDQAAQDKELFKKEMEAKKEEFKAQIEQSREDIKNAMEAKKAEFKKLVDAKKEELKAKADALREKIKTDLTKIRDEKKRQTTQNIIDKVAELNTKAVTNLNNLTDQIEEALLRIEARANAAEIKGIDVSKTKAEIVKAKALVVQVRALILTQSTKVYTTNITTDAALKNAMSRVKESLNGDIKVLRDKVKTLHEATRVAATTLAQTPGIDDETSATTTTPTTPTTTVDTTKVEDTTTTTTNQ